MVIDAVARVDAQLFQGVNRRFKNGHASALSKPATLGE
jgi:hypothetical protein